MIKKETRGGYRPGARKRTNAEKGMETKVTKSIVIYPSSFEKLKKEAEKIGTNPSGVIEILIKNHLTD